MFFKVVIIKLGRSDGAKVLALRVKVEDLIGEYEGPGPGGAASVGLVGSVAMGAQLDLD